MEETRLFPHPFPLANIRVYRFPTNACMVDSQKKRWGGWVCIQARKWSSSPAPEGVHRPGPTRSHSIGPSTGRSSSGGTPSTGGELLRRRTQGTEELLHAEEKGRMNVNGQWHKCTHASSLILDINRRAQAATVTKFKAVHRSSGWALSPGSKRTWRLVPPQGSLQ